MLTAAAVKERALALGFDLCGIASADAHPELAFLTEWLDRGYAGDMAWMRSSAGNRADVRAVVPGARSVIVTGTVYSVADDAGVGDSAGHTEPGDARGIIARYARGADYHDVLRRRINDLLAWLHAESAEPFEARAFVDSGPVQERVYAQYAGLGWIGKNTCLINPELGSWLFLGEIICTLPLEPDTQGLEQCGSCTRCLEACPTGALVEPGVLDSTRCLSYLTIETESGIPEPFRDALGARIYGCDICQDVCPYNQPHPESADAAWRPRPAFDRPRLVELWRQSDADLRTMTRGTAITRAGVAGLRRSLAVAIGNSGDPEAVAALVVPDPDQPSVDDPIVQEHIDWALTRNAKLP